MNSEESAPDRVLGERGATPVNRAISVQSRLSSVLAMTLMSAARVGIARLVLRQYHDATEPCTPERTKRIGQSRPGRDGAAELGEDRSAAAIAGARASPRRHSAGRFAARFAA